jgi:hypothetical protein
MSMANPELLQKIEAPPELEESVDGVKPSGGRRRNRKKAKGALDHQEAMNQFIKNLNSKKGDEAFGAGKFGLPRANAGGHHTGKNSRIVSRKTSPMGVNKHSS